MVLHLQELQVIFKKKHISQHYNVKGILTANRDLVLIVKTSAELIMTCHRQIECFSKAQEKTFRHPKSLPSSKEVFMFKESFKQLQKKRSTKSTPLAGP